MRADCLFLNLGGSQTWCRDCAAALNSQASAVSINGGKFESLVDEPGARYIQVFEGEVEAAGMHAAHTHRVPYPLSADDIRLQHNCCGTESCY